MRKVVKLKTIQQENKAAQVWIEHLINRMILEELELPTPLAAKVVQHLSKQRKK